MMPSELLQEKQRVQRCLAQESSSIQHYLFQAHLAAQEIAQAYGVHLRYADVLPTPGAALLDMGELIRQTQA